MSDQLTLSTSDHVGVSVPLLLSTPSIAFPGTFEQRLHTVNRRGEDATTLRFSPARLQAICEQEAARTGEYTVQIDQIEGVAAINLTFQPVTLEEKEASRRRSRELANKLVDVLYAARK